MKNISLLKFGNRYVNCKFNINATILILSIIMFPIESYSRQRQKMRV